MTEQKWDIIVRSGAGAFDMDLKGLLRSKDLIWLLVRRNFVAQYKQTVLGPAWAVLQPFFSTVVFSIIFGSIAGLGAAGVPNFIFYLSGNIIWGLFSHCLNEAAGTFTSNAGILGKVYFPRLVMPITITLTQFINFFIQFGFMLAFLVFYWVTNKGVHPNAYILLTPFLLLQIALLGMGFGTIASSLTTKYRDLHIALAFGVSLWTYASPIAYDMFGRASLMPGSKYYCYYMLNPVTPILNVFRYSFLGIGGIDWLYYGISWGTTMIISICGILMYSKVEKNFIDTI